MHERLTKQRRWLQINQDSTRFLIVILIVSIYTSKIYAVDLGKVGNTFRIEEEAFTAMMKRKLEEVDMEKERKKIEKIARDKIKNPAPVKGISAATEERTFYFDPTCATDDEDGISQIMVWILMAIYWSLVFITSIRSFFELKTNDENWYKQKCFRKFIIWIKDTWRSRSSL